MGVSTSWVSHDTPNATPISGWIWLDWDELVWMPDNKKPLISKGLVYFCGHL